MKTRIDPEFKERTGLPPIEEVRTIALERARTMLQSETVRARLK